MSTTTRILLGFLLIVLVGFYSLMNRLADRVERQYLEAAEEPMVDMAEVLAALLAQEFNQENFEFRDWRQAFDDVSRREIEARIYNLLKTSVDMDVYVTDESGIVLFDSRNGADEDMDYSQFFDVRRTLRGGYGARSTRTDEADELSSIMYVAAPIRKHDQIIGVVSVSKPQASMFAFIAETQHRIRLYGWISLLATMLAAVLVSHLFSSPIRKLTRYARAVQRGERVALPQLASPDVRTLGRALEEMRDSLEDRKYVETYVQTLTHEMKSPVAAIRGAAELLQEENMPPDQRQRFLGNIQTETDRLQNVVDRLLALSAIESRKALKNPEALVLTDLADEVIAAHEHALEAKQLKLRKEFQSRPTVRGEAFLLEIALGNLIQNAIDFSPPGGTIQITVRQDPEQDSIFVTIEDEGDGIPDYALPRVFDRFYSLRHPATGRKSSGLGLCFVREAAELHGGTVRLANRPQGRGARATLTLRA